MDLLLEISSVCAMLIIPMAIVGLVWIKVFGDDAAYIEEHPEAVRDSDGQRTFSSRPIGQQSFLILTAIVACLGIISPVYDRFFAPPTAEEIAAEEERQLEAERMAKIEAEKRRSERAEAEAREKQKAVREKQNFVSSLGKNVTEIVDVDFKKLAAQHAKETELQNDATQKKLVDTYVRIRGEIADVDSDGDIKHGYQRYMIQMIEGQGFDLLVATASCYATSELDKKKIESLNIGARATLVGKVWKYGDVLGLQLSFCTIE